MADWNGDLERWLAPFLARLGHKARRRMCPLYVAGLIGPGDRKSVEPMAARLAPGDYDQLHHFIASGVWDEAPLTEELAIQADKLIGGASAVLVVDDTALPKKGSHSVGVAPQYASALGKTANCQTLVSLTLARDEVPVMIGLRLFLPESWTGDGERMTKARVPEDCRTARTKPGIALAEIDRIRAAGVRFATVLADAGYGLSAPFRQGLDARGLKWAVGIPKQQKVYPSNVKLVFPVAGRGGPASALFPISFPRPRKPCSPRRSGEASVGVREPRDLWRPLRRRAGADRRWVRHSASTTRACSTCQAKKPGWSASAAPRASANTIFPTCLPYASLKTLAATIKARWVCEQAHQQLKEELGLDHFEGRSWHGLHRHALMTMIAYAYLQTRRLAEASGGKKNPPKARRKPTLPAIRRAVIAILARAPPYRCPHCRRTLRRPLE